MVNEARITAARTCEQRPTDGEIGPKEERDSLCGHLIFVRLMRGSSGGETGFGGANTTSLSQIRLNAAHRRWEPLVTSLWLVRRDVGGRRNITA